MEFSLGIFDTRVAGMGIASEKDEAMCTSQRDRILVAQTWEAPRRVIHEVEAESKRRTHAGGSFDGCGM
jgi:hypothetical protein